MEYLILLAVLAILAGVVFGREALQARAGQRKFRDSLFQDFGNLPTRKDSPESSARIAGFYKKHKGAHQLDDMTWNDLDMDSVFRRMNYCFSAAGEEYLYYMLRSTGSSPAQLEHLEEAVSWFQGHAEERVKVQELMREVGHTGKFSLYDYLDHLDALGERSNRKHHLTNALYLPFLLLAPYKLSVALIGLACVCVWQIVRYFGDKGEIGEYITSFAYIIRLIDTCEKICGIDLPPCQAETDKMRELIDRLQGVRRGFGWVFLSGQQKTGGNPLEMLLVYLNMIFHLDLILFNKMLRELRLHLEDVDGLIAGAGYLEAAIAVGAFRASLKDGWCVPELAESGSLTLRMEDGYHPLLEQPVKNTVHAERGVLLTGSNASGKSTFLKTVALNAILAQTIHTCTAQSYAAPVFDIYSSMALRDDLEGGESYYIVEIKALKRILDAAGRGRTLCFVDEVLRGTNTVERIAASAEILRSLAGEGILCFAATHDIELTDLLQAQYDNYHFEEEIRGNDIFFPYKLLPGKSSTRNAIRLLEIMGYEKEIVDRAFARAKAFMESSTWQA